MKPRTRNAIVACTALATILPAPIANAADEQAVETMVLEEIVVTSRRRAENLQSVPDSVTAFGSQAIERAGIDDVQDFVDLTPNISMRETFRAGVTFITIRGITTGQQGWAPVTYVVDGVQAGSLDAINQGALTDIERIEVLKGPQGALYGAGAIAGAINIVTKKPTNEMEYKAQASYGSGNDMKLSGVVSGPLVEDRVLFRLGAYYRNTDGVIESTDGDGLDYEEQISLKGRLLFDFDALTIDVRGAYSDVTAGAAAQEIVASPDLIDNFDTPGPARGVRGEEKREFKEFSAKIDWDMGGGTLTSVTGYSDIEQDLFGSASWQKGPGVGLFGPFGGPTDAFNDFFQDLADNFETFTQDVRFASNSDQRVRWLVGLSYMDRRVENLLSVGGLLQGLEKDEGDMVRLLYRPDVRKDEIWGGYGQVSVDVTDRLELTGAVRYDTNNYNATQYTDLSYTTPVPTPDGIITQKAKNSRWQPKIQLSYDWSDDVMTYVTYAEGFRFGFFNTGNLTAPEDTKNYELGLKTTLADGRVRLNGALFHIDYSDQQFTSVIGEAPFRLTTNVPQANINGGELEVSALLTEELEFSGGLGVTDAKIKGGQRSPGTPEYSVNLSLTYTRELGDGWDLISRADYRRQGTMMLWDGAGGVFEVEEKDFLNLRLKLRHDNWFIGAFADNLTNEQQANDFGSVGFGYLRANSLPRVIGVEAGFSF